MSDSGFDIFGYMPKKIKIYFRFLKTCLQFRRYLDIAKNDMEFTALRQKASESPPQPEPAAGDLGEIL